MVRGPSARPSRVRLLDVWLLWPHACLGREVATMAAVYLLASTAQRFRLDLKLGELKEDLKLLYGLAGPVPMLVSERKSRTAAPT